MSRQKILVVGADSFVGSRVVRALQAGDWAEPITATFDAPALRAGLSTVDGVVNAVMGSPQRIRAAATALYGSADALHTSARIVHLGSMTVYGKDDGVFAETAALPEFLEPYAAAHAAAEALAGARPNAVILRPGCEYGPGCPQWSLRVADWLRARRIGDLGAGGDGYCNLIYIDDLVAAVLMSLRSPAAAGVFNLALPDPPTWNEYLISFGIALGAVPIRRMTRRRWKIETRLLAPPLKIAELAQGRMGLSNRSLPEAIPPSFQQLCTQAIRLDVSRAEQVLQMRWTPLDAGIAATAQWVREVRGG